MTDEEYRQQVKKRWQESMALLGLDDAGPEPEPEKESPAPTKHTPAAPHLPQTELDQYERPRPAHADAPPVEAQTPNRDVRDRHRRELEPEEVMTSPRESEPAPEPIEELDREAPPAPERESADDESGRRRRGRRGRRGKRPESPTTEKEGDADATVGMEPAAAKEESPERENRGRRGRGRQRQRSAKIAEPQPAEQDELATDEAANDNDIGDDEPNDLSEWNVPSWQELIASLYRPER
jgi:ribonuclease E